MNDFELPSNIRQIGGVDEHLRIYVEDYAVSYLKRFAESGGESDRVAFLVGKYMVIDSQGYLFISGAIQGKFTKYDEGAWTFSDESFEYAVSQAEKYFEGCEIVGWMQSQPGYGTGLNPVCADYHMNNFIKPYQVLFVVDPTEKLESFYAWEKGMSGMNESKGYFVYYDRNKGMQEYMLDNKLTNVRGFSKSKTTKDTEKEGGEGTGEEKPRGTARIRGTASRNDGAVKEEKRETPEYRRLVNMVVSLSAVLFVICFIMGAGLMQGDGRINNLENDLAALNGAYSYAISQINQLQDQTRTMIASQINEPEEVVPAAVTQPDDTSNFLIDQAVVTPKPESVPAATQRPEASGTTEAEPERTEAPNTGSGQPEGEQASNITLPNATIPPSKTPELPSQSPSRNTGSNTGTDPNPGPNSGAFRPVIGDYPEDEFDTYTVQRGDTLTGICFKYYGTDEMIELVMEVNNITQPDMIYFGKVLYMPKADAQVNSDPLTEEEP